MTCEIHYLECKNEIKETIIKVAGGQSISIRLPICPECKEPISGYDYFQAKLWTLRFHVECFFKSVHADCHYRAEFFKDTLLPSLQHDRKIRWLEYLETGNNANAERISIST